MTTSRMDFDCRSRPSISRNAAGAAHRAVLAPFLATSHCELLPSQLPRALNVSSTPAICDDLDRVSAIWHQLTSGSGACLRLPSLAILFALTAPVFGGEGPFFIPYTHQLEEPGNLEIGNRSITRKPAGANRFFGAATEFEYGVTAW